RKTTWGVFRSFFGFDPTRRHNVRLIVKNVPAGGNMVIDSITVFRDQPTAPLPFGSTENDEIGPIIFGNGQDDSWVFDANKRNASNNSLHSVAKKTAHIGPFISFQIPA